ncbi:50S ribosomal protein L7/L12 [Clostridium acetireducens DSM 10703]|uniref:50S ribosomal protein L7/L12 n=1 Tax=Clostridium acetireducens DSM 10703 TaxID=1121290 RepID=A0A1E8EZW8_9CLOT|nr:ribosomal protein L7/L12 [Clostridium acetireducens]OFI06693.1 50S ribosomal protein L7/L12 [Clostridium acetireducens DSM 10703]
MESMFIAVITMLAIILNVNINRIQRNQERIESKLNGIIEHLGVPELSIENKINDELKDELIKLVEANKKVKAVKKLRDATGMGLIEAKNYVDSLG